MSEKKSNSGALSLLLIVVFLIFLVLKLTQIGMVANWSWWAVTAPLWAPAVISIGLFLIIVIVKALFSKKD
jgi:hypothetical protein